MDIHEERHPGVAVVRTADGTCKACKMLKQKAYRNSHATERATEQAAERARNIAYKAAHPPTERSRSGWEWDRACKAYDKAESRLDETMQAYVKAKRKAGALATETVV
jgi:hypothetical protein